MVKNQRNSCCHMGCPPMFVNLHFHRGYSLGPQKSKPLIIYGIVSVLAPLGWQINTAFVERLNLSLRQHVAAIGRRVSTLCKGEDGLCQQLALYHMYDNFCLPHASLRVPLPQLLPTNGTGSAKQWRPWTPAMAAGLTDQVWSLRAVLLFRVPPWPQTAGV